MNRREMLCHLPLLALPSTPQPRRPLLQAHCDWPISVADQAKLRIEIRRQLADTDYADAVLLIIPHRCHVTLNQPVSLKAPE